MATINSIMRSYRSAVRRSDREQQIRNREAAKRFKEQQRQLEYSNAAEAVADWSNYVKILKSLHKESSEKLNWSRIKSTPRPIRPTYEDTNECLAKAKLKKFKPNLLDKIFNLTLKRIKKLENKILLAKKQDEDNFNHTISTYRNHLSDWEKLQKISLGVEKKQPDAYLKALQYFEPFAEIAELGTQIEFKFTENKIQIDIITNNIDIIPNYELKQTSTGKLSKKNMSKSNYYELYQDHICSVVLRVSREIFAYLPVDYAIVNALSETVDTQSGHLKNVVILSVKVVPETIEKLNLEMIDPSDCMVNFIHNMNFRKNSGFKEVARL